MSSHSRTKSESTCEFLCFHNCSKEKYKSEYLKTEPQHLKLPKLSLRKVIEDDARTHKFKKSISDKNLAQKFRCETSRSHKDVKEMLLFKKKAEVEREIQKVDQQMSRLTLKYQKNIY